jgi:NADPH:quinone reductase-like Zn-dependent oxidoreductase
MKAIRIHRHGASEVLQVDEIPLPDLQPDEVLIRIKTAALNHLDLWVRRGFPGIKLPLIMGSDAAGIIENLGDAVLAESTFKTGDEVIHVPYRVSGDVSDLLHHQDQLADEYLIPGEHVDGVQAEYIAVPADFILPKPVKLSWETAAAFPLCYMTSFHMLANKIEIETGDWILIWGASSGVGSAAIQIAKYFGAKVIATAGSIEKQEFASIIGADYVINHKEENVSRRVRDITSGKGVRYVFEHVGRDSWPHSMRALQKGGVIITCGASSGPEVEIDLRHLFIKHQQIIGSTMGNRSDLKKLIALIEADSLNPVVDSVFHFEKVRKAHQRLELGKHMGKVILSF